MVVGRSPTRPHVHPPPTTHTPGSNPNIDNVGNNFYDTVGPNPKAALSTWDQVLRAQDYKRRSFSSMDSNGDGYVDAKVLCCDALTIPL